MEKYGSTYTLNHQIRAIGNSAEKWVKTVVEWQREEKKARMASEAELAKMGKTKNPLIKLLLPEPDVEPELRTQEKDVEEVEEGEEEEEAVVVKRRKRGKMVIEEDPENEEEQFFMAELDTFVPVNMMEFAMGDTAGHGDLVEEQGGILGLDDFFNVSILPEMEIEQPADESVCIEIGNIPDEARIERVKEREKEVPIEHGEEVGGDDEGEIRNPLNLRHQTWYPKNS